MNAKRTEPESTFEQSLERLETIVAEMETGDLSLDAMIAHFEEGSKLVKLCSARLNEVEKKIEKLVSLQDPGATEPLDAPDEA